VPHDPEAQPKGIVGFLRAALILLAISNGSRTLSAKSLSRDFDFQLDRGMMRNQSDRVASTLGNSTDYPRSAG
jgi:hypothetical protein